MAMQVLALANDGAVSHVQRGKQRRRTVPDIVVSHGPRTAFFQRQPRLCAIQRLDWLFSSQQRTKACSGAFW